MLVENKFKILSENSINLFLELNNQKLLSKDSLINLFKTENITDSNKFIDIQEVDTCTLLEQPLISIIIPTFNRMQMLKECVESILSQDYKNIEIIIVDDFSSDNTEIYAKELLRKYNFISYFKNPANKGPGYSRNFAYNKCKGDFVIFADDDDYYICDNFFTKAITILNSKDEISFVSANSIIKREDTLEYSFKRINLSGEIKSNEYIENFQTKYMKSNSTFTSVFRKSLLEKVMFSKLEMMNDSTIYLMALIAGNAYILDDIIGVYRVHKNNLTFNLDLDFIISNLLEKKKVFDQLKSNPSFSLSNNWLLNQVKLTSKYYILSSKPTKNDFDRLLDWCQNNIEEKEEISDFISKLWLDNN